MDRRQRADLEGAQALGRLSDTMVFSLGRALRERSGTVLPAEDLRSFADAASLFEWLASDTQTPPVRSDGMFTSGGYLDALRVVQGRAKGAHVERYAQRLATLLRTVVERQSVAEGEEDALEALRDLFADVGELTLSRAGELSLSQETHWPPMRQAI